MLDVFDDLFAAVHAEIDVEVRHRHPLGVQEAFEQQRIAQGVKVGDGQRIGHQRPGARPAPRADRNVVVLGPFDEVGDDQEIARKAHLFDDAQLEAQPFFVFLDRHGMGNDRQARFQALGRLAAQFHHLVVGEARQDGLALGHLEGAAARDLDRVFQRLRQVGEQRRHFLGRLQIMLRRQAAPGFLLVDIGAFRDADHRVMRLIHLRLGKIDVVRGDQRQAKVIGQLHMAAFAQPFGIRKAAAFARVALQLDIKSRREGGGKAAHQRFGLAGLTRLKKASHRPVRAAGQADQAAGMRLYLRQRHMRQRTVAAQVEAGIQLHQVHVARFGLREQHDGRRRAGAFTGLGGVVVERQLTADDRLDPRPRRGDREFQRREHVVGVGHCNGGHRHLFGQTGQLLDRNGAFKQRIFRVDAKMDESGGAGHEATLAEPGGQ